MSKLIPSSILSLGCAVALTGGMSMAQAQEAAPGIVGKNNWLFYRHEISSPADNPGVAASIDLIRRANKQLERNGVALVVAMAPLKIRVHAENLPDSVRLDDHLKNNYDRMLKSLRDGGVYAADLNTAFLNSPLRVAPMPLYFRLDTHWSSSGALLAAETVAQSIQGNAKLKPLIDALPVVGYKLTWSPNDWPVAGDLPLQLAKGAPTYEKELIKIFQVEKTAAGGASLLGDAPAVGVTLLGSSYTADWTNFPVAMRYALQRDVLSISVNALQGQWVGLHTYLRDDSFQTNKPKILIWEMPERDMRSPPDMKYRDAQYVMDNTEWLLQTSALVQQACAASSVKVQVDSKGMRAAQNANGKVTAAGTGADEFVELNLDKPIDRLDYLAARLTTAGSTAITLDASGPGVKARRYTVKVAGDDAAHNLRSALAVQGGGKGFTKVRIYPGKSNNFALSDIQVCRQPEDL